MYFHPSPPLRARTRTHTHAHARTHTHTLVSGTSEPTQDEASQAFGLWQEAS